MQFFVNSVPVCGDTVPLGVQGENLATQITADVSGWLDQWPDGQVIVRLIDANRQSHLADTVVNDGTLVWIVTAADTAQGGYGVGVIELVQGDVVKKSEPFATRVITDPQASGQAPEPVPGWVEETIARMEELEASATQSADDAQTSAGNAQTGAQSAQAAAAQAAQSAEDAAAVLPQVETAGAAQVTAIQAAGQQQTQAVTTAGAQQVSAVQTEGADQRSAIETAGTAQVTAIQAEGQTQQTAIQQKGADTLASIPADYTELSGDVADLKSQMDEVLDIETIPSKNLNKTSYPDSYTTKGVTFAKNEDGSITMSGSPTGDIFWPSPIADKKWLLPAGTYTLSGGRFRMSATLNLYANKSDTSSAMQKSSGANSTTFTTEQDYWAWLRFDVVSTAVTDGVTLYPQVELGSQATEYQAPNYIAYNSRVISGIADDISALEESVSDYDADIASLNTRVDAVTEFDVGKNLVDPDKRVVGAIQSDGTVSASGAWANYSTSDFIEIEPDANYVFSAFNTSYSKPVSTARVVTLVFDENKTPISGTYQNVGSGGTTVIATGSTGKYVRVCTIATYKFQLEKGVSYTDYEAYSGKNVSALPLGAVPMAQAQAGNVLYGKKWAVCGDSFTDGADTGTIEDGKYQGRRIVYPYIIGNRNDMEIVKFFNGGRTLAFPAEPRTFINSLTNPNYADYYQNIPTDVDYITIYLGINDANHASGSSGDGEDTTGYIPLGTIADDTTASYYGAWNVVLTWLIANRPHAHIGIIVTNGNSDDAYRQAQIAIAAKYGLPYIDMNGDARTPAMLRTSNPDIASAVKNALIEKWRVSSSNTHPNDAAHLFESTFIENFLRSI